MEKASKQDFGSDGEDIAAGFLSGKNFTVIERNYRYGKYGEIDIIARKGGLVVFCEVKNRSSDKFGGALYSISPKKKKSIKTAARAFITDNPEYNRPEFTFRFDLISISGQKVEWVEDMFR